jgi:hypothetical protein
MTAKRQIRATVALIVLLLVWAMLAGAAEAEDVCKGPDKSGGITTHACNGISVGAPKVFDNRTLTLMLESLSQTLQAQQQNYIDQKSVAAALANIQGFTQTESSTNLSLTTTPTPATDVKTTLNSGNVDANGNPLPNTFQRQTDVNRASVTPQAPAIDTLPAFQGFTPTYGNSASDLLSDQVNLTYQIFNLRMILERALSDRLNPDATGENKTRRQAVLGFNVTLDPPRTANDAVAVVEITLQTCDKEKKTCEEEAKKGSKDEDRRPLSLVALMPQEKTYNAAALSSKSNAFAGSAVVSSFQVGFSARKRGQIFYLYRDSDTISYERMTGDPTKIVFGWMFRPVLGRRSISPGLRQLFAIMALPSVDCTKADPNDAAIAADDKAKVDSTCKEDFQPHLISNVRTYWKKYDHGTLTSFDRRDTNRAKEFWYGLSLTLAEPQIFDQNKYLNKAAYIVDVRPSSDYEHDLRPRVSDVTWRSTGAKNIVISARGNNFFSQTKVALGDTTYADGSGLILKSNQAFDLVTTFDALVNGPGTILGRYDISVPLTKDEIPDSLKNGVEVQKAFLKPAIAGTRKIEIHLQKQASEQQLTEIKSLEAADNSASSRVDAASELMASNARRDKASNTVERAAAQNELDIAHVAFEATGASTTDITVLQAQANSAHVAFMRRYHEIHRLDAQSLPLLQVTKTLQAPETPVVSVNGTPLDLPYEISNTTEGGMQHVVIQANVKDSLVSDSGGGIVKVSWPFYPQNKWTATYRFYNPDLAFEVTRVSTKTILIHRIDGPSFMNGPETEKGSCWNLIAADEEEPLTPACPKKPAPKPDPSKPAAAKKDKAEPAAPPLPPPSDYVVIATLDSLPDKVVLVAPSGSTYNLTVPPVKAKDDKVVPIELKQYDSQWIEIKSSDLTTSTTAAADSAAAASSAKGVKDFTGLDAVEANNGPVNYVLPDPDPKVLDPKTKQPKPPSSIKVEITRALTSKPGTIDIAFRAGKKLLGTRQLHITQTEWGNKGDK